MPPPPSPLNKTGGLELPSRIGLLEPNPKTSNTIVTAKYNLVTFLPVCLYNLLHPMKRAANFLFLVVGALQLTPLNPAGGGTPTTWFSLFVILGIDLIVLAIDDLNRHRADRETNNQKVDIVSRDASSGAVSEREASWSGVKAGDIVRVHVNAIVPADLLLLRGSEEASGQCWVNTKALDGESDLKLRLAPNHGCTPEEAPADAPLAKQLDWSALAGELRCEEPNDKVNDFVGELCLARPPAGVGDKIAISPVNILLRGCQLQNTDWVLGLVITCGNETKIKWVAPRRRPRANASPRAAPSRSARRSRPLDAPCCSVLLRAAPCCSVLLRCPALPTLTDPLGRVPAPPSLHPTNRPYPPPPSTPHRYLLTPYQKHTRNHNQHKMSVVDLWNPADVRLLYPRSG